MIYRVLVEHDASDPSRCAYSAYVPDIPNCMTCADSLDDLAVSVREVAELAIEMHEEHGRTFPAPTGFQFLIQVPA